MRRFVTVPALELRAFFYTSHPSSEDVRANIHLDYVHRDRFAQIIRMNATATVEDEGHRRFVGEGFQKFQIEPTAVTMDGSDGYGQSIDAALRNQLLGFFGRGLYDVAP